MSGAASIQGRDAGKSPFRTSAPTTPSAAEKGLTVHCPVEADGDVCWSSGPSRSPVTVGPSNVHSIVFKGRFRPSPVAFKKASLQVQM